MLADIEISDKSYGLKHLLTDIKFSIDDNEKVGVVGRNGLGKSTLLNILSGSDKDYIGKIIYQKGLIIVSTKQEHYMVDKSETVLKYILNGLPNYKRLSDIIATYPEAMGQDMRKIAIYSDALTEFSNQGFYEIDEKIKNDLNDFQLGDIADKPLVSLSGGQKRLVEIIKVMNSNAQLALLDEPTNHMDYVSKAKFISWIKQTKMSMLIVTHDRDVLDEVNRILELKDSKITSFEGNYKKYLKQNLSQTVQAMSDFDVVGKRINNLETKAVNYQRLKEKSHSPSSIQHFKRLELKSKEELESLKSVQKPTFWIDKKSLDGLQYKAAGNYQKFKTKNINLNINKNEINHNQEIIAEADNLSIGYEKPLLKNINFKLYKDSVIELRGRNGIGKTTLINLLLSLKDNQTSTHIKIFEGNAYFNGQIKVGIYNQEVSDFYFGLSLKEAVDKIYSDQMIEITNTKIRQVISNYLFTSEDLDTKIEQLSGGQKARLQLIKMLSNDPQLLILDEPTNHLDLPSIEELEQSLGSYHGAILYVSHDNYFREHIGGETICLDENSII